MEIVAYKIDDYGYVWKGWCFNTMNDVIDFCIKYYGDVKRAEFVIPEDKVVTYWLNNWDLWEEK